MKINPIRFSTDFEQVSYFTEFRQDMPQKTIQKIQEPCIGYGTSHFQ